MKLDAPFRFLATLLQDAISDPRSLYRFIRHYQHLRSLSHSSGHLPVVSIFEAVPEAANIPITLENIFELPIFPVGPLGPNETSSTTLQDSFYLALLLKTTDAKIIVEFGTSFGESTLLFALNSPPEATIYTTDFPERPAIGTKIKDHPLQGKIKQSYVKTGEWALDHLKGSVDFIFIDASHAYEDVLKDSHKAFSLLKPGGVICWHDYVFTFRDDVVKALDSLYLQEQKAIRKLAYANLSFYREKQNPVF